MGTWTLLHTFADNTAYAATEATFAAILNEQTYGTPPFTLAQSWEEGPAFQGVIDLYPNALMAYSLRQCRNAYAGYLVRVRRASDNTEQDIGISNFQLDVASLSSFCSGTNGFVSVFYDQSGNGNNLTQTTASKQPLIYDAVTGVVTTNGGNAIRFDGSDDGLLSAVNLLRPYSLFAVFSEYANSQRVIAAKNTNTYIARNRTNPGSVYVSGTTIVSGAFGSLNIDLLATYISDSASNFYYNSTDITTNSSAKDWGIFSLCTENPYNEAGSAFIKEIIVYDSNKATDRAAIDSNINAFYSIYP